MENDFKFEEAIHSFSREIQEISRKARSIIHETLPDVVEVVWIKQKNIGFGTGIKKKTEHFCWIMPAKNHVTFGFNYGAELPDSMNLLEGTGKLFRHIKIKSEEQLVNKDFLKLLKFSTTYRVPKTK